MLFIMVILALRRKRKLNKIKKERIEVIVSNRVENPSPVAQSILGKISPSKS